MRSQSRFAVYALLLINLTVWSVFIGAWHALPAEAASSSFEISELLVNPAAPQTDAADEFIELHNAGTTAVNAQDYSLRIGTKTFHLPAGTVAPDDYVVYTAAQSPLSLVNTGGQLDLLGASGSVVDSTSWKTAVSGSSWAKINNVWQWTDTVTKGAANAGSAVNPPSPGTTGPGQGNGSIAPLLITEMLPDPASPQTDAKDEFVELYNPNDAAVHLKGYVIKTGSSLGNKVTLPDVIIEPDAYYIVTSAATTLTLSNSGSHVALFGPDGNQIGATVVYPAAQSGVAYALDGPSWAWTTSATPGTDNIITAPAAKVSTAGLSSSTAKTTSSKASSSSAPRSTKVPTGPKATKGTVKAASTTAPPSLASAASKTSGLWLLFALVGFTIAYVIYEFRYDVRNFYYKLRRHPVARS